MTLPQYRDRDFSLEVVDDGGKLTSTFVGNADMAATGPLSELLPQLHDKLVERGARELAVDFQQLEFMNSACLKLFVNWIVQIQETPADQQYKLMFRSNPELRWQRRSLQALACFASDLVLVDP
ncbi:MAG TPA: hypothetical protein VGM39_22890 [Kofleriaceae bacterium]